MSSLKSKLRGRLMSSHGARRNTKNNIWLVYSFKTQGDITLASTNECIYWASRLETNPDIKSFRFGCELKAKYPWEETFKKRDFILVETAAGTYEFHHLITGATDETRTDVTTISDQGELEMMQVTLFNTKDIGQLANYSRRWLQLMSFSNQIRNEACDVESDLVNLAVRSRNSGTVGALLDYLATHDAMKVLGVFAREAILGNIELEFADAGFGRNTFWCIRGTK